CGLLASAGVASVSVYRKPSVGILCTGNELVQVGHTLKAGQVYDSNSHALLAALKLFPVETVHCEYAGDALPEIEKKLQQLLATSDMVLITGGVSVGDYDFVSKALDNQGVQCGFHNVKQRPGKPLYFGTRERKLIFGLPGNPASVLTCFYYYVWPALRTCCGFQMVRHQSFHFPLQASFHKRNALTQFLRALYEKNSIRILDHQESYKMDSFARSHGLAILPEETGQISAGDLVEFFFFNL
ncbi:MAG TPA: molybdopterin molybdotransferase MoeA, partial [Chitinophagaceae bacterium]|nr:molybdopterin molybdotransferase MoeA [Chitinophagaceae bacterium]